MPAMNALLFGAMSFGLLGAATAAGSKMIETDFVPAPQVQTVEYRAEPATVAVVQTQADRDAADDAEFARLMEAAPDVGSFGDSVTVDPETGVETRVSGFGFSDS